LEGLNALGSAASVEYLYQSRLVMTFAAVPFGVAGLAICVLQVGRRWRRLTAPVALILFMILFGTVNRITRPVAKKLIEDGRIYGVAVCVWTPSAIVLAAAATILLSSRAWIRPTSASRSASA
jgi:asparagine N-glycosylation enzyme membrane subunit Stt3